MFDTFFNRPTSLYGVPIVESWQAVEVVKIDRRVRGGYMNRWLIREYIEEAKPAAFTVTLPSGAKRLVIHPRLLDKMLFELRKQNVI